MLPPNEQMLYEIRQEAAFYQIHGLLHAVEECQQQLEKTKRNEPSKEKKYKVVFTPSDSFKTTFKKWTIKEGYELESCIALPDKVRPRAIPITFIHVLGNGFDFYSLLLGQRRYVV